MRRSEEIAAVVALRELGYDVVATPRGVLVTTVFGDVPANAVLDPGDVIVALDGVPVRTTAELRARIADVRPGAAAGADRPPQGQAGRRDGADDRRPGRSVASDRRDPHRAGRGIELPFEVDIDLGRVGGPSAGLPFALEIARQLGRDVTKGCAIAATGALALDGTVAPIGGVKQKTIGARRAGVDYFLVPAGENAEDAQENAEGPRDHPCRKFSTGVAEAGNGRREVLTLQALRPY